MSTPSEPGPWVIGIEVGGTKLQLGLGHGDGKLRALERRRVEPAQGSAGILAQINELVPALMAQAGLASGQVAAVGIGFGGPVDARTGVIIRSHQINGWDGFNLAGWVRETLRIPTVSIQNDADTAGLAEARFGAGVGFSPVLYVTIGSGIGGGLILNGQIYRGSGAGALEIGHLWVVDRTTSDLDVLKLEDIASGWAIAKAGRDYAERHLSSGQSHWSVLQMAGGNPARIDTAMIARAARAGDTEAGFILGKAVMAMANALNQGITLLAPHRIILGGGVSLIGEDLWFEPIRRQLDLHVFPPFRGTFDIVPASLGEEVVIHGALALAHDALELEQDAPATV